jgi:hypothetical protein
LDGWHAHLDNLVAAGDVDGGERRSRKAERLDGGEEASAVLGGGPDEDVEIAREARSAMEGERVRADDDELNQPRARV